METNVFYYHILIQIFIWNYSKIEWVFIVLLLNIDYVRCHSVIGKYSTTELLPPPWSWFIPLNTTATCLQIFIHQGKTHWIVFYPFVVTFKVLETSYNFINGRFLMSLSFFLSPDVHKTKKHSLSCFQETEKKCKLLGPDSFHASWHWRFLPQLHHIDDYTKISCVKVIISCPITAWEILLGHFGRKMNKNVNSELCLC